MADIKRILVCFNVENKSHADLLKRCQEEFGVNLSSGIRTILWHYFHSTQQTQSNPTSEISFNSIL